MSGGTYRVTAAAVLVTVGLRDHLVERGRELPSGVAKVDVDRLVGKGLIEAAEPDAPADEPQGEPAGGESVDLDALNLDELRTYAAENGIDIGDATRKADIRAAIDASRA